MTAGFCFAIAVFEISSAYVEEFRRTTHCLSLTVEFLEMRYDRQYLKRDYPVGWGIYDYILIIILSLKKTEGNIFLHIHAFFCYNYR